MNMDSFPISGENEIPEAVEYEEVLDDGQYIENNGQIQDYEEYIPDGTGQYFYERVEEKKPLNFRPSGTRGTAYPVGYHNQAMVQHPVGVSSLSVRPFLPIKTERPPIGAFNRPKASSSTFYTPPALLAPRREPNAVDVANQSFSSNLIHNIFPSNKTPKPPKIRRVSKKKPCNCNKSMCLKLYCDCFANGEFCLDCNCKDCHNNLEHEAERSRAIKSSLERNPSAFKPKIGVTAKPTGKTVDMERLHQRGCHCKKSNCLKNYCECYEAKVPCTDRCKCQACRNTEDDRHNKFKDRFSTTAGGLAQLAAAAAADSRGRSRSMDSEFEECDAAETEGHQKAQMNSKSQPWYYMTEDVIEATTMCLVSQAQEFEQAMGEEELERSVLKEFGRCLEQIIGSATSCLPQPPLQTLPIANAPAAVPTSSSS